MTTILGGERGTAAGADEACAQRVPGAGIDPYLPGYCLLGTVGAVLAFIMVRFTVDDAFLTWRYGQSLALGYWNWNPGAGYRVEAYGNPLFAVLSAVPAALGVPAELFFKLVGLCLIAGYLLVVRRLAVPRLQKLLLTGCALLNPIFFAHVFGGLETASFALLLALLFGLLYTRGRLGSLGHAAALAVVLSRPEGVVFALVAEAWCVHLNRGREDVLAAGALLSTIAGYGVVRAVYFRSLFPYPYLIDSGSQASDVSLLVHGLLGLLGAFGAVVGFLLVMETVRRILWRDRRIGAVGRPSSPWRDATPVVFAATSAAVVFGLYRIVQLQMDFGNRFRWQLLFPVALVLLSRPLLAPRRAFVPAQARAEPVDRPRPPSARWTALAVFICGVTSIWGASAHQSTTMVGAAAAFAVPACAALAYATGRRWPIALAAVCSVMAVSTVTVEGMLDWAAYRYHLAAAPQTIGRDLADDRALRGVIAVEDAGVLPYRLRPDQWALDLSGEADPFAIHPPVPAAVSSDLVAAVVGSAQPYGDGAWWGDASSAAVFKTMLAERFKQVGALFYAPGYWLRVYVKPGLEGRLPQQLRQAQQASVTEDSESSGALLTEHLFDFPFLHG